MKKTEKTSNDKTIKDIDDPCIVNKVIDLCLWYQIEDSHRWMEMINLQIKNCNLQIEFLLKNKPFWFQKEKIKEYNYKIEELENLIHKYYQDLEEEVKIIQKMQRQLSTKE